MEQQLNPIAFDNMQSRYNVLMALESKLTAAGVKVSRQMDKNLFGVWYRAKEAVADSNKILFFNIMLSNSKELYESMKAIAKVNGVDISSITGRN